MNFTLPSNGTTTVVLVFSLMTVGLILWNKFKPNLDQREYVVTEQPKTAPNSLQSKIPVRVNRIGME